MAGNSFGNLFRLTSFGESHGAAIGGVIDGCWPGIAIDVSAIQHQLQRRRPGQSAITSPRQEEDEVEFLSGLLDGITTGAPIAFLVRNKDQRSTDYAALKDVFRPSHADYTWEAKFGLRDHRGGGRSSARETISRVVAGSIAEQLLLSLGIRVVAFVSQVGPIRMDDIQIPPLKEIVDQQAVRCPDPHLAASMESYISDIGSSGDSCGGIITVIATGVPPGIGEPVFDKLHADLGKAMFSINAVKGVEVGSGFRSVTLKGSEHNDAFYTDESGRVRTNTNHSGGIQGGISNGEDILLNIAFKPVASIKTQQTTTDRMGQEQKLHIEGRHDPCVVPRAVPIVEAMAALVLVDHIMLQRAINPSISG
jgi:chorismate synthase